MTNSLILAVGLFAALITYDPGKRSKSTIFRNARAVGSVTDDFGLRGKMNFADPLVAPVLQTHRQREATDYEK